MTEVLDIRRSSTQPPDNVEIDVAIPAPFRSKLIKKKTSKIHECEICAKIFFRPSGLKTHMNSHKKIKPFICEFAGCTRTFAARSNAKRHLRTHGIEIPIKPRKLPPYVVGFETPTVSPEAADRVVVKPSRYKVRWRDQKPSTFRTP